MSITIKEVAEYAGVAPSTVSRVVHNNPKISLETQEKVREAMKVLGYHPNAAARSLARGRTHTLGLIIPNSAEDLFTKPFFIMAMRGLSIEAQRRGYNIMFSFSSSAEEEVSFLKQFIRQNIVDGVILMTSSRDDKCMAYLEEKRCPYTVIGRPESRFEHALWVDNDNFQAMYNLVSNLLQKGLRRIALLGGPQQFSVTQNRLRGYQEALRTHGITIDEDLICLAGTYREVEGYQGMKTVSQRTSFDSVIATDGFIALGALDYLKEHDAMVPIAGFNNTTRSQCSTPPLTTVDIQPELLGRRAAALLIDHLSGIEHAPRYAIVDTILIERESTLSL